MGKKHSNNKWNYNQTSANDNFFGMNRGNMWRGLSSFCRNYRRSFYRCRRPNNNLIKWIVFGSLIGILIVSVIGIPIALVIILCALAYLLFKC